MAQTFYDVSASRGLVRKLVNPVRMTVPQPSRRRGEKRRLRLVLGNRKGMPEVFTFFGSPGVGSAVCVICSFVLLNVTCHRHVSALESMAGTTGLEPATSAVTVQKRAVTY